MQKRRTVFVSAAVAALLGVCVLTAQRGGLGAVALAADRATAAATTTGCGKTATLTSGTYTIQSSGQNRTYILSMPTNYDQNHPYRLIFGLHWLNGTANDVATGGSDGAVWAFYGQKQLSNNSTIFVAPQGINNGWANTNGQDVILVDDIRNLVETGLCVDTTQVFAMGWSYGGAMSYALACAQPTIFRAVVVYSGANLSGCSPGAQPVAYFGIHGTHDSVLNISNGRTLRDTFVKNNGCTPQNPPEPAQGSLTHIITTYSGCRAGYPVQWAAFDGDHTPDPVDGTTATSGARTWTSAAAFTFLSQFQSATPAPSPTASEPSPTAPPTGTAACRVTDAINAWDTGLTANITITNTGTTAINGWSLVFTLPSGQTITSGWNATYTTTSGQMTATNMSYNAAIAPNASVSIGFQANHTGNTAAPTSFVLNGAACFVA